MKSQVLELGHLLSFEVGRFRRNHQGMYSCGQYALGWHHRQLRNHHQAFYLLCFYLELISVVAPEDDLSQEDLGDEYQGLFRVLSNAIYHLEQTAVEVSNKAVGVGFFKAQHLGPFLSKLIIQLGITPNLKRCLYSDRELCQLEDFQLLFDQGGFVGGQYLSGGPTGNHREVWEVLRQSWSLPYGEMAKTAVVGDQHLQVLYRYLLFQAQIKQEKIRTAPLVI